MSPSNNQIVFLFRTNKNRGIELLIFRPKAIAEINQYHLMQYITPPTFCSSQKDRTSQAIIVSTIF